MCVCACMHDENVTLFSHCVALLLYIFSRLSVVPLCELKEPAERRETNALCFNVRGEGDDVILLLFVV